MSISFEEFCRDEVVAGKTLVLSLLLAFFMMGAATARCVPMEDKGA